MGNIIIQMETWMEPDPGERGSDGMEVDSTKRLQGRMTNVQWDLKYAEWRLIGLKKANQSSLCILWLIVTISLTVWECGSDINLRLATRTPKEKKAVLSWQEDPTYREINAWMLAVMHGTGQGVKCITERESLW